MSRRGFLAAAGAGLTAAGLHAQASAETQGQPTDPASRPTVPPAKQPTATSEFRPKTEYRPEPTGDGGNAWIGKPVSQTARAQDGKPTVPGEPPKKLGYAIVGLGKLALGEVLPAFGLTKRCRPAALVSGDLDKARAIADNYGVPRESCYRYADFEQIADNPDIDIVYVITPNSLHEEWVVKAAEAGKHVLCEKPMATTVEACQRMIDACEKANRKLMIAYRVHYEPYNQKMIEWSRQQKFGPIQMITSDTVLDVGGPNQWRCDVELSGGGSLFDIGIYSLNAMRYLTGEEPVAVSAMMYSDPKDPRFRGELEQSITFQLRFPSGILTNSTSSFGTATKNQYTVMAEGGWYGLEPATTYTRLQGFCQHADEPDTVCQLNLPHVNHFAEEMDAFARFIVEDEPVRTPGEMGLLDVKYMRLLYEAAREGCTLRVPPRE